MRSKVLIPLSTLLICFIISNNPLLAQSKDRNNPTPLRSKVISEIASPSGTVYWHKLTAGPGELVIEMSVEGTYVLGLFTPGNARFVLYDTNMQEVMDESIFDGHHGVERKNKSLILQSKQDFLLSIGLGGGGAYMIRFKGAIVLPSKESEEDDD